MRLVFAGTPEFAERALASLVAAGHEILAVLTQPDRPAGRGLRAAESPVKRFATARNLAVLQPPTLKTAPEVEHIRSLAADALIVAAYGRILPQGLLDAARHGALNIHASLLPRWRGAAPIQRALLAGDRESGISIMQMDAGLDTGPVLSRHPIPVAADDDAGSLHDRLAALGAQAIVATLAQVEAGHARAVPQPATGVTYASKIVKADTRLDWTQPAATAERTVRAFRPAPGAFSLLDGEPVKIWRASVLEGEAGEPGTLTRVSSDALVIACGHGALAVTELQRAGGRRLTAGEFLRGHPLTRGARFA